MKKLLSSFLFVAIMLSSVPFHASAKGPDDPLPVSTTSEARSAQLLSRLQEIKAMDTKSLSREEKKELRKEVKEIRKEMKATKGIYLSVGAIIIIVLLLILLL